jgi:hypothetical protein
MAKAPPPPPAAQVDTDSLDWRVIEQRARGVAPHVIASELGCSIADVARIIGDHLRMRRAGGARETEHYAELAMMRTDSVLAALADRLFPSADLGSGELIHDRDFAALARVYLSTVEAQARITGAIQDTGRGADARTRSALLQLGGEIGEAVRANPDMLREYIAALRDKGKDAAFRAAALSLQAAPTDSN